MFCLAYNHTFYNTYSLLVKINVCYHSLKFDLIVCLFLNI